MRTERTPEHQALRNLLADNIRTGRRLAAHKMKRTPAQAWEIIATATKLGAFEPWRLAS